MSNTAAVLKKEEILLEEEILCDRCSYDLEYVISETNSLYHYCNKCGFNKDLVEKHITLDILFKNMQKILSNMVNKNSDKIIVSISRENNEVILAINNNECHRITFLNNLNKNEIKMLRYSIEYLIDDNFGEGKVTSIINIDL